MKKTKIFIIYAVLFSGLFSFTSCTTYYIPVESFRQQFSGIDSTRLKSVTVRGPVGETFHYQANPLSIINCVDKQGNPFKLQNGPSIEIRFTHGEKNKRTVYYFDRIFVNDSAVVGVQSRFISAIRKTIPLKEITKIEIQDGQKKFRYIEQ